ncbi:Cyclochlorotine biosynthesis protein O [Colletotrichum sidae]|uniref:Cyclochlorotine biosynthesis protein O n=1 Tax=Colletotrichum sidae TaxID=1347389 RepID=A0A4R8TLG6_9PEZI|nr:Cyclochlorotine biosynthesis protein O [Colletotrichum sidae]
MAGRYFQLDAALGAKDAEDEAFLAPVHEVFEYEDVQFDNAFWQPSPYKGKPTPELEAKWQELWYYGSFDLPDSYLPALNKSADGVGGDAWARTASGSLLAGLEVFHNLHCLNLVRQYVHRDEYDYSSDPAFHGDAELVRAHVDHCIEALRIRLQCASDVTPFLHTSGSKGNQPDFNSQHRCPKYDRIIDWAKKRQIMVETTGAKGGHGHHGK